MFKFLSVLTYKIINLFTFTDIKKLKAIIKIWGEVDINKNF